MNNRSQYWTDLAEYDMDTAMAMLQTQRWLYVGFMCHQVIEKMLKAYYTATQPEQPPYSHSITKLSRVSGLLEQLSDDQLTLISTLEPLNIEARYPAYKDQLLRNLTPQFCENLIAQTKSFQQWILTKL